MNIINIRSEYKIQINSLSLFGYSRAIEIIMYYLMINDEFMKYIIAFIIQLITNVIFNILKHINVNI